MGNGSVASALCSTPPGWRGVWLVAREDLACWHLAVNVLWVCALISSWWLSRCHQGGCAVAAELCLLHCPPCFVIDGFCSCLCALYCWGVAGTYVCPVYHVEPCVSAEWGRVGPQSLACCWHILVHSSAVLSLAAHSLFPLLTSHESNSPKWTMSVRLAAGSGRCCLSAQVGWLFVAHLAHPLAA